MRNITATDRKTNGFPELAVIGCGAAATYVHLPALGCLRWRPQVLVDPHIERAERLAERWKVPRAVKDVSDLAAGEIEAAIIATPPGLHARIGLPLLDAGIHLLVEKPFAVSVLDARVMVETAAKTGACLAVGHICRFMFIYRWIKAVLDAGLLGNIERVEVCEGVNHHSLRQGAGIKGAGWNSPSYWDAAMAGGGVLMDAGPHVLDALLWWLGPVDEVTYRDDSLGGVEADARLDLTFACGATGTVELSRIRTLPNTFVIVGSRGRIEAAGYRSESPHRNALLRVEPPALRGFKLDGCHGTTIWNREVWEPNLPGKRELGDWLQAIHSRRPAFASGTSAVPVVELIERCYMNRKPLTTPWQAHPMERAGIAEPEESADHLQTRVRSGTVASLSKSARQQPLRSMHSASDMRRLSGKTVLVTGGTGFIGGRLVERLVEEGAIVRVAVRTFRNAARLARFAPEAVQLRAFDMGAENAADAVNTLVAGCDTVFHLAVDYASLQANVQGLRLLGAACLKHAVRRLVFTSSVSVYWPWPDGPLDETHRIIGRPGDPNVPCQREVRRMICEDGLRATVLQPTHVYGPFGGYWTERQVKMLLRGPVVLPTPDDGICNPVYVDDVVHAFILAAVRDEAVGETFLISGAEPTTWSEFYRHYARAVGRTGGIRLYSRQEIRVREMTSLQGLLRVLRRYAARRPRMLALLRTIKRLARRSLRPIKPLVRPGVEVVRRWRAVRGFGERIDGREILPSDADRDLFASQCSVRIAKARSLLGYEPVFSLERGMELTTAYIRWAYGHLCLDPAESQQTEAEPAAIVRRAWLRLRSRRLVRNPKASPVKGK